MYKIDVESSSSGTHYHWFLRDMTKANWPVVDCGSAPYRPAAYKAAEQAHQAKLASDGPADPLNNRDYKLIVDTVTAPDKHYWWAIQDVATGKIVAHGRNRESSLAQQEALDALNKIRGQRGTPMPAGIGPQPASNPRPREMPTTRNIRRPIKRSATARVLKYCGPGLTKDAVGVSSYEYIRGPQLRQSAPLTKIIADGIDGRSMSFAAVISSRDRDRTGDILEPRGCDLSAFHLNSLWFFEHDYKSIPIGSSHDSSGELYVAIEPDVVVARCFMHQRGAGAKMAAEVFELVAEGVYRGVSVGFSPDENHAKALRGGGIHFGSWQLNEVSITAMPANASAIIIRKMLDRGRITTPSLRRVLEPLAERAPVYAVSGWRG
jgi:hypothetical protein